MKANVKNILITLLVFVIVTSVAVIVTGLLFAIVPIKGVSMHPTVGDGDFVFILKVGSFKRGDIVVIENVDEDGNAERLLKRIIAIEGDTVETRNVEGEERYFVNGEMLEEPYVNNGQEAKGRQPLITVPEGRFYYLGDNRRVSADSYSSTTSGSKLGYMDNIVGKVLFKGNLDNFSFAGV